MNKQDFINKLKDALSKLPQDEIQKTADYYSEIIDDAVEEGENEQEVIAKLGSIDEIAKKIISETSLSKIVKENMRQKKEQIKENIREGKNSAVPIILIIIGSPLWIGIAIAAFSAALSLYIAAWSVIISLFAVFGSFAISGIACLVLSPFLLKVNIMKAVLAFGTALILIGLSVFMFYLSLFLSKAFIKLTRLIFWGIKNSFTKKEEKENEYE